MKKDLCPCVDCKRRELGCHGKCEAYTAWKQKEQARKDIVNEKLNREREYMSYSEDVKERIRKRGGRPC